MTTAILVAIAMMWLPVALLLLGYGEPKGTGFAAAVVGIVTVVGATIQATYYDDQFTAGLLYVHGIFYLSVGYSFLTGQTDLRPMGNVALTTAIASTIYMILFITGGPLVDGERLVEADTYLAIASAGYAVLTYEVFLNTYGRLSGKVLAVSLIIWVAVGLWIPSFWLMVAGKLPFS
jgi:hypothetical protein